MPDLIWNEVADWLEPDGSLLDLYVFNTTMADWQQVIDLIRTQRWSFDYTVDGSPTPLPERAQEVLAHRGNATTTLGIHPIPGILVNTHFFTDEEIEFDLDPQELQGQEHLDTVCAVIRAVGNAVGKPVVLTPENQPAQPFAIYLTAEDRFVLASPTESGPSPTPTLDTK